MFFSIILAEENKNGNWIDDPHLDRLARGRVKKQYEGPRPLIDLLVLFRWVGDTTFSNLRS